MGKLSAKQISIEFVYAGIFYNESIIKNKFNKSNHHYHYHHHRQQQQQMNNQQCSNDKVISKSLAMFRNFTEKSMKT